MRNTFNDDDVFEYLSVISITGKGKNAVGIVLGEIDENLISSFNELSDKDGKINEFVANIVNMPTKKDYNEDEDEYEDDDDEEEENLHTDQIIIEGFIPDKKYKFVKITTGLENFNTYTMKEKKDKINELLSKMLLEKGSEQCREFTVKEFDTLPIEERKKSIREIINCLTAQNTSSNEKITEVIKKLNAVNISSDPKQTELYVAYESADDLDSKKILYKCIEDTGQEHAIEIEDLMNKNSSLKINAKINGKSVELDKLGENFRKITPQSKFSITSCTSSPLAGIALVSAIEALMNLYSAFPAGGFSSFGGRRSSKKKKSRKKQKRRTRKFRNKIK